jgi:hypothetical protein
MAVMVTGVIAMAVMATAVLLDHHWGIRFMLLVIISDENYGQV